MFSLDMVGAPLFVLARGAVCIEAMNAAMRSLLREQGSMAAPPLPCRCEDVLGTDVAAQLAASLEHRAEDAAPIGCRLGPERRAVLLTPARLPGNGERWLVTVQPDTPRRERELSARIGELQAILDWLPIGVEIMDADFRTVMLNVHERELLGYSTEEASDLEDWWRLAYPDPVYRELARNAWTEGVALAQATDSEMVPQEWQVRCRDGSRKTIQFRYRAVGGTHVNVYLDVTRERQLEAMLLDMATTDSLTSLFNRRYFFEKGATCLHAIAGSDEPLSVLVIDIDHFKRVNDRHGHAVGDAVLQEIAGRCRAILRKGDVLARIGGEEFAAILPQTPAEEATAIAERLRREVCAVPVSGPFGEILVTLSIGGTCAQGDEHDFDAVLERADRALYVAKNLGRNRVQLSVPAAAEQPLEGPLAAPARQPAEVGAPYEDAAKRASTDSCRS